MIDDTRLTHRVKDKIEEIAQCLINAPKSSQDLMSGKSGEAIFWAYYSLYKNSNTYNDSSQIILSDIFDSINEGFQYPSFAAGLAGIGWTVEHLAQNDFINANTNDIIGSLDDFLYPFMQDYIRNGNYDYLHGAMGIGLYYLNRNSNAIANQYLEELVEELELRSTQKAEGISWEITLVPEENLKGYNLSLSHGSASIIVFLSRLFEAGIQTSKVANLVSGAVSYILHNKQDTTKYRYQYPGVISNNGLMPKASNGGRLAWCYNDLGISIALWQAGQLFCNESWKQEAISSLMHIINITTKEESCVVDAGLCHGATGIAYIYSRMFKYTNIEAFNETASFWFDQSLKMATYNDGLAGYKLYRAPQYGGRQNEYGFLEGIAGIGLAMISAVSDIDPKWDRALLLS